LKKEIEGRDGFTQIAAVVEDLTFQILIHDVHAVDMVLQQFGQGGPLVPRVQPEMTGLVQKDQTRQGRLQPVMVSRFFPEEIDLAEG
jgi:hypothetical protein